jgi:four helix bundle protein
MFVRLPKTSEAQVLGRQGVAFGANYREAYRGRSTPEFIFKCGDCLKEIEETAYWLELLVDSRIVSGEKLAALRQEITELTAIFVTIIKRSKE